MIVKNTFRSKVIIARTVEKGCNKNKSRIIGIMVDGEYLWGKLNDAIYNASTIIEADKESKEV